MTHFPSLLVPGGPTYPSPKCSTEGRGQGPRREVWYGSAKPGFVGLRAGEGTARSSALGQKEGKLIQGLLVCSLKEVTSKMFLDAVHSFLIPVNSLPRRNDCYPIVLNMVMMQHTHTRTHLLPKGEHEYVCVRDQVQIFEFNHSHPEQFMVITVGM